jgi:hypothetical protein
VVFSAAVARPKVAKVNTNALRKIELLIVMPKRYNFLGPDFAKKRKKPAIKAGF